VVQSPTSPFSGARLASHEKSVLLVVLLESQYVVLVNNVLLGVEELLALAVLVSLPKLVSELELVYTLELEVLGHTISDS
jgi:hypothetical protein